MKLKEIFIDSYRSINNQKIVIDFNCKGFIGLNESGKSNILNAIRGLDENYSFCLKDKSKINNKLPYVTFRFSIDQVELKEISDKISKELRPCPPKDENIFKKFNFSYFDTIVYLPESSQDCVNALKFEYDLDYDLNSDYLYITEGQDLPQPEVIIENQTYSLSDSILIENQVLAPEIATQFAPTKDGQFLNKLKGLINEYFEKNLPSVIFWEYDKKYLLPSEITYEEFMKNNEPFENSAPLFNMFLLSDRLQIYGSDDLAKRISEWKNDSSLRKKEAAILTEDINKYIKGIWSDYDQDLSIDLEENKITIHINDPSSSAKNYYEMEARSQGFKTFISFILTIGAEYENGTLNNFILLLDEPETHLHPSGVRFMRNELFKLANGGNYVFFATHSIFMIDRKELKRHYIVSKDNESTKINPVDRNNITQEAVIYEALGTSIDEFSISNLNIMFEGDVDLFLFEFFINNCLPKKNNVLRDYRLLNGGGTKRMSEFFTRKMIPKGSEWNIILDNDSPGQKFKEGLAKDVEENNHTLKFYFYSEIQNFEIEDILPRQLVEESTNKSFKDLNLDYEFKFVENDLRSFSAIISEFLNKNKVVKNDFEEHFKENLKTNCESIIKEVLKEKKIEEKNKKFKELLPQYYKFLEPILEAFKIPNKETE
jgi:predicted ATP-dependent endonuclease of OLD family